jgi:hypothetical protein
VDQPGAAGLLDARERTRDLTHRHVALARHGRQRAERCNPPEQLQVIETERVHDGQFGQAGAPMVSAKRLAVELRRQAMDDFWSALGHALRVAWLRAGHVIRHAANKTKTAAIAPASRGLRGSARKAGDNGRQPVG